MPDSKLNRVRPGVVPSRKPIPEVDAPPKQKICFGFQWWQQPNCFGIGKIPTSWFVSLIDRLKGMSAIDIADLLGETNQNLRNELRFHDIDWNAKYIPIQRKDLTLSKYAENEGVELQQFHVSKALGRVIGFFDEFQVFQIVILDPFHNMQPSKDYNYRVKPTSVGECELTSIIAQLHMAIMARVSDASVADAALDAIDECVVARTGYSIVTQITQKTAERVKACTGQSPQYSFNDLLEIACDALASCDSRKPQNS